MAPSLSNPSASTSSSNSGPSDVATLYSKFHSNLQPSVALEDQQRNIILVSVFFAILGLLAIGTFSGYYWKARQRKKKRKRLTLSDLEKSTRTIRTTVDLTPPARSYNAHGERPRALQRNQSFLDEKMPNLYILPEVELGPPSSPWLDRYAPKVPSSLRDEVMYRQQGDNVPAAL